MDDGLLLLSGIQHFAFCRRQWALIHNYGQIDDLARSRSSHAFPGRIANLLMVMVCLVFLLIREIAFG
mgnify:CR=1 FL=1